MLECGNGVVEPQEECDDGNRVSFDGCDDSCKFELCGNGVMNFLEACDDGNRVSNDGCSQTCEIEPENIKEMDVAPRRLEWNINSRVVGGNGDKSIQITYSGSGHALTIRASDIQIAGRNAAQFIATARSVSLPYELGGLHDLMIDVSYIGPTGNNSVADATLKVTGHFFTESRHVEVPIRAYVYNPEIEALPGVVRSYQDAPCGGFEGDDTWEAPGRVGLAVNNYPSTQRVTAIAETMVSHGTIIAKPHDPNISLPVDLRPGESLEYELIWSGQGPALEEMGEVALTVQDVESGGIYYVSQQVSYRQFEDCSAPRLVIADFLNFGTSEVGIVSAEPLPYFNTGSADLEITSIEACQEPAPNATFEHQASLPVTLAPTGLSGSQSIPFVVTPHEPGWHSMCMKIITNDAVGEYEMNLFTSTVGRTAAMIPALIELTPSNPTKMAQIVNVGALPIVIRQGALVIDSGFTFSLGARSYPVTLQPGDILDVLVSIVDPEVDASGTLDLDTDPQDGLPVVGESMGLRFEVP